MVARFFVFLAATGAALAGAGGVFEVPAASQRLLGLSFAEAERRDVEATRSFPGRFEIPSCARHAVAAVMPGRVKLRVREGQTVKKGEALFSVESGAWLRLNAELSARRGELAVAEKELEIARGRVELLRGAGARNPDLERDAAVKPLEIARLKESIAALEAETELALRGFARGEAADVLVAAAPADGRVEALGLNNGAWAEEGATVVTMVEDGRIRFRADVPAMDFAHLGEITKDFARVTHICNAGDAAAHGDGHGEASGGGTLEAGVPTGENSLVPLYFTPHEYVGWMQSGVAGELSVILERGKDTERIAVPDAAVVADGTGFCAYAKVGEEKFAKVAVTPRAHANGWTEVEGVKEGTVVVVNGAYELKLLAPGSGKKKVSGHFHADGKFHEGSHDGEGGDAHGEDVHEHGPGCSHGKTEQQPATSSQQPTGAAGPLRVKAKEEHGHVHGAGCNH